MRRWGRFVLAISGLGCVLSTAACGGGGGGSSNGGATVGIIATPAPGATGSTGVTLANCDQNVSVQGKRATQSVTTTTYNLTSYPSGMSVSAAGTSLGMTPVSYTPSFSAAASNVVFTDVTQSYSLCIVQASHASRTLFYNGAADTTGSIGTVASSSVARASTAPVVALAAVHHPLRRASLGAVSPTQLLVKYAASRVESGTRTIADVERSAGVAQARTLGPAGGSTISRIVTVPSGGSATQLMQSLKSDATVQSVALVHKRFALSVTPVYPNDYEFTRDQTHQWDMYRIQAPYAWGYTTGSSSINIAVIDTGYDSKNLDLAGKVTHAESVINGTVTQGAAAAVDVDGHGTNVSGIAAADTNNGTSVAGTGYNTSLQEYRIFSNDASSPGANTSDEAQAIYDAVSNGAKVISLSLGGTEDGGIDEAEYDAVEYAVAQNVVVVAAAGNERQDGVNTVDFPAAYPGVIAVGASALNDTAHPNSLTGATEYVAPYSNSGPGLALVAPGGDPSTTDDADLLHWILNLDTTQPSTASNQCSDVTNCLALFAGTSQATPHVSGTAALMLAINPSLTPAQIRNILMATADNINDASQGAGRLNAYRALASVAGDTPPTLPGNTDYVAIAYSNSGGTTPAILDVNFPNGVPVAADGTFRIADVSNTAAPYHIAVWADTNGDGKVDAGDYFGATTSLCQPTTPCTAAATGITVAPVQAGFTLP